MKIIIIGSSEDSPFFSLFPQVNETLSQLKSSGYRLALLSNWDSSLRNLLKKYKIEDCFEVITISGEVNFDKPDPKIFEKALNDLKVEKEDVVYVGDTLSDNIYGAQGAGIQPIWANYKGNTLPNDLVDIVIINSIEDLLNKVDR